MKIEVRKISKECEGRITAPFTPMNEAKDVAEYTAFHIPITGLYRCEFPTPYFQWKDGNEVDVSDVLVIEQNWIYTMFASCNCKTYPLAVWDSRQDLFSFGEYAPEWIKVPTETELEDVFHSITALPEMGGVTTVQDFLDRYTLNGVWNTDHVDHVIANIRYYCPRFFNVISETVTIEALKRVHADLMLPENEYMIAITKEWEKEIKRLIQILIDQSNENK